MNSGSILWIQNSEYLWVNKRGLFTARCAAFALTLAQLRLRHRFSRLIDTGLTSRYVVEIATTYLASFNCIVNRGVLLGFPAVEFVVRRVHFAHCFIRLIIRLLFGGWSQLGTTGPSQIMKAYLNVWIYRTFSLCHASRRVPKKHMTLERR